MTSNQWNQIPWRERLPISPPFTLPRKFIDAKHIPESLRDYVKTSGLGHLRERLSDPQRHGYIGDVKDRKRSGYGSMLYSDGAIFTGHWMDDRFEGEGAFDWGDGNFYCGEFHKGRQHGTGFYRWPTGGTYIGQWIMDHMNGSGTYTRNDGVQYIGEWKDDNQSGWGTRRHPPRCAYGANKIFSREKLFREKWEGKDNCLFSKEMKLHPDKMWTAVTLEKKAFLDIEVVCQDEIDSMASWKRRMEDRTCTQGYKYQKLSHAFDSDYEPLVPELGQG